MIGIQLQHGALIPFSVGLHLLVARTGREAPKLACLLPKKPNFAPFLAQKRLRNGSGTAVGTAKKHLSARLALLLGVINDRGTFHLHRARHRGG